MQLMRTTALIVLVALTACSHHIGDATGPALPIAELACPAHVDAGSQFDVDASASEPPAGEASFKSATIAMVPGAATPKDALASGLKTALTAPNSAHAVVTVKLVVTDKKGRTAEARCRITVDPAAAGEGEGEGGEGEGEGAPIDLTGSFAMVAFDMPELSGGNLDPSVQCGPAPVLALVGVQQTDKHVSMTITPCAVWMPDVQILNSGVQTMQVPGAVTAALPPLSADFDLASTSAGTAFAPPLDQLGVAEIVGARLADPDGPMPTDANDPQVSDDDRDGWPGVTVFASGNAQDVIYRRYIRAFDGTIESNDLVDGTWRADTSAALLSSNFFFDTIPVGSGLTSSFQMTRVDASSTCDDLLGNSDALISAAPSVAPPDDCPEF
jgi:hypothetical protein